MLGTVAATAVLAFAAPAQAQRELPPLGEEPLPCPIDAPVRVASADTLSRFTALAGCAPEAVIVSPATELPRPRTPVAIGASGEGVEDPTPGLFMAAGKKPPRKRGRKDPPAAIVETGTLGPKGLRVVRIAPAEQFPEIEEYVEAAPLPSAPVVLASAPVPVTAAAAGPLTAAAILALRPASYTTNYDSMISAAAVRHGVDPLVLHAVITQESRYRQGALSPVGARGLMQVMPGTGAMLGVRNPAHLFDPATNIDAGAKLLRRLWTRFSGRFDLVLAAYNAGEGAVTKYGYRVPPYRETINYVAGVQAIYRKLAGERGLSLAGR